MQDLCTDYGPVRAVDGVTLAVGEGSVTAVLGANGAGKTSLLRTISGLERASAGHVRLDWSRTSWAWRSRTSSGAAWRRSPRAAA